jgi:glycine C-acetyltransferase
LDIFDKIDLTHGGPLGRYKGMAHGYFSFPKLEGVIGPHMKFRGKDVLNWSTTDYLGLASNTEVLSVDSAAASSWGFSVPMGARVLSGNTATHEAFEEKLASFLKKEDAFVVNSDYQAIVSAIDALCSRPDIIVYDAGVHAGIVDGVYLHKVKGGRSMVFAHNDIENCELKLQLASESLKAKGNKGGILLITEGLFAMSGEIGILNQISALKEKYDFRLMIDDAQGFGVLGESGRGTAEFMGVLDKVDILLGSFTNAAAGKGGFVASTEKVVNFLRYNMRSQIYDNALSSAIVEGNMFRLNMIAQHQDWREKVASVAAELQHGLRKLGFRILSDEHSPITTITIDSTTNGGEESAINELMNVVVDLRECYGIFCNVVTAPYMPQGTLLLRLISSAAHTSDDVKCTIEAFAQVGKKLAAGDYARQTVVGLCMR